MKQQKTIQQLVEERAKIKKCKIGISIIKETGETLDSIKKARDTADVVIYSNHEIPDFKTKVFSTDEEIGRALVSDFKKGEIDQFVRGQVDDFGVVDEFKKQFGVPEEEKRICFAALEDIHGRQFVLAIASNPEGQTLEDKIRIIDGTTTWMKKEFKLEPKVAVMATCRPGSFGKDSVMTKSYEEAEEVVKFLKNKGVEAKNIHIELQSALPWANVIMASNGTIGNQIFRALVLLGGGKNIITPTVFPGKGAYEDNSRNETDWYNHIVFACALANSK